MEIQTTYKFEYEKDGKILHGISTGFLPDYATRTIETISILCPAKGKDLKRTATGEVKGYFIFEGGDSMDNYEEVEHEDRRHKREVENADNE